MALERVHGRAARGGEDADGRDRDEHESLGRAVLIRRSAALKEAALHPRALLLAKELRASRQRTTTCDDSVRAVSRPCGARASAGCRRGTRAPKSSSCPESPKDDASSERRRHLRLKRTTPEVKLNSFLFVFAYIRLIEGGNQSWRISG